MGISSSSTRSSSLYQNANNTQQVRSRTKARNLMTICVTFLVMCAIVVVIIVPLYEEDKIFQSSSSSPPPPASLVVVTQVEAKFNLSYTTFNQTYGSLILPLQISDALSTPAANIVVVYFRPGSVIAGIQFLGANATTVQSAFLTQAALSHSKLRNETFFLNTFLSATSIANDAVTDCSTRLCAMIYSSSSSSSSTGVSSSSTGRAVNSSSSSTGSASSSSSSTGPGA
jgi:hypothetical protein